MSVIKKIKYKIEDGSLAEMISEAKWMYGYAKKYWSMILFYIVTGLISIGIGLCGSVASKYLVDAITGQSEYRILLVAAIVILAAMISIIVNAATSRIGTKITLKVNREIQLDVYEKILNIDWESISQYHSGDIVNRFSTDAGTVSGSVISLIPSFVTKAVQFAGILCIILYYDATMALLALIAAPITLIVSKKLTKKMREYNKRKLIINSQMMAFNQESFSNIQSIKGFSLNKIFKKRLIDVQDRYINMSLDYNKFTIYTSLFMSSVGLLTTYACLGWGLYRLKMGFITYGTVTMFIQLASSLSSTFSTLVSIVPSAISATTSAGRIMEIINMPEEISAYEEEAGKIENETIQNGISIRMNNVTFKYKSGGNVLENAYISANPNEIVGLVGHSGGGKTTIIRIMLGLANIKEGEGYIEDCEGLKIPFSPSARRFMSYVPQGNTIFAGTVADNMRMVKPDATDEEIIIALKEACAYDFIGKLPDGINSVIGEKGTGFSEGQNQRLSIARALLSDTPIMLLDEATSALDPDTEKRLLANIVSSATNRTCILTTHRLSVLSQCDRVYRVSDSNVTEVGKDEIHKLISYF